MFDSFANFPGRPAATANRAGAGLWQSRAGAAVLAGWRGYVQGLSRRSKAIPLYFERNAVIVIGAWAALFAAVSLLRAAFPAMPYQHWTDLLPVMVQYGLIILAPLLAFVIATHSFPRGVRLAQPDLRLCRYGKWQPINPLDASGDTGYGPAGFMASLLVGLLLNVPLRSFEFVLAMPVIGPGAPHWANLLSVLMTADVALMGFFYTICFVAALRCSPFFPRLLLFTWLLDVNMQMQIANLMSAAGNLPQLVSEPLANLLVGNEKKVFISVIVWLPYLILSERVNKTYRQRIRAA